MVFLKLQPPLPMQANDHEDFMEAFNNYARYSWPEAHLEDAMVYLRRSKLVVGLPQSLRDAIPTSVEECKRRMRPADP